MFYLYLKTHNITGMKYLGYTKNNPEKYKGSGLYWKKHIKQYGYDVTTDILFESENIEDISKEGIRFSKIWNIVENSEFANLCEEDGNKLYGNANINFRGHPQSEETRNKISKNNARAHEGKIGRKHPAFGHKVTEKTLENVKFMIEKNLNEGPWNKGKTGFKHSDETKDKMSKSASRNSKEIVECPYCKKKGGKPAMIRFHFSNCDRK